MIERADARARRTRRVPALAAVAVLAGSASALAATDADPFGASWPEGEGRNLAGAWCGGCHSLNLVEQQGLTRPGWDELLTWMTEKQNMPPLKGDMRDTVLDYLAANFGTGRELPAADADAGFGELVPAQGIDLPILEIRPPD